MVSWYDHFAAKGLRQGQVLSVWGMEKALGANRLFSVSDLHVDYEVNRRWLLGLSKSDYTEDYLMVAGDLSGQLDLVKRAFDELKERFRGVGFVPGNHDLWLEPGFVDSRQKHQKLRSVMRSMEVDHAEVVVGPWLVVPLLSWYDFSFGECSPSLRDFWVDFRKIGWPGGADPKEITRFFLGKNKPVLERAALKRLGKKVVSFSHFVPRKDLLDGVGDFRGVDIRGALGTPFLDEQIGLLGSSVHVYGHVHMNRSVLVEGRSYRNTAFGYPKEASLRKGLFEIVDGA